MKDFTMKGPVRFACKRDAHPRKGQMNWWEDMGYYKSKTAKRQKLKKDIERDLERLPLKEICGSTPLADQGSVRAGTGSIPGIQTGGLVRTEVISFE